MSEFEADIGPQITARLFELLGAEREWSLVEERGFTWWPAGHELAVWAEEPQADEPGSSCRVYACTPLFEGVPESEELYELISEQNEEALLSALLYEPEEGTLELTASVVAHGGNAELAAELLRHAAALQVCRAPKLVKKLAAELAELGAGAAAPLSSDHPTNGPRRKPARLCAAIEKLYAPRGRGGSAFGQADFAAVRGLESNPAVELQVDAGGLTAEFRFYEEEGDNLETIVEGLSPHGPSTAVLQVSAEEPHPDLGSGCLVLLSLPIPGDDAVLANDLNLLEAEELIDAHGLGAWCSGPRGITHVSFWPSAAHRPDLVELLYRGVAERVMWAREALTE